MDSDTYCNNRGISQFFLVVNEIYYKLVCEVDWINSVVPKENPSTHLRPTVKCLKATHTQGDICRPVQGLWPNIELETLIYKICESINLEYIKNNITGYTGIATRTSYAFWWNRCKSKDNSSELAEPVVKYFGTINWKPRMKHLFKCTELKL